MLLAQTKEINARFCYLSEKSVEIAIEPVRVFNLFVYVFRVIECLKHSCSGAVPGLGTRRSVTTQGRPKKSAPESFIFHIVTGPSCLCSRILNPFQSTRSIVVDVICMFSWGKLTPLKFRQVEKVNKERLYLDVNLPSYKKIKSNNVDFTFFSKVFQLTSIDFIVIFDNKNFQYKLYNALNAFYKLKNNNISFTYLLKTKNIAYIFYSFVLLDLPYITVTPWEF